tara:strand:- start:1612 stop:1929 length:318 start_codon:yes stop_codon:yes gene_type:complete
MNLTTRQREIYEKIRLVDSDWDEASFSVVWNDILKLNKFLSIGNGKLILEFDNTNYAMIKFEKNEQIALEEKIHLSEIIQLDGKDNETKQIAQTIKNLAERIITS